MKSVLGTIILFTLSLLSINLQSQSWTQLADYPDSLGWYGPAGFSVNGKGYVGAAGGRGSAFNHEFYEYDPITNSWSQKASFPDSNNRRTVASFSIGNYGYVGVGWTGSKSLYSFYQYDPVTNTWTRKADYPGTGGRVNLYTSLNGKGYIGGGAVGVGDQQQDFWEYDPTNNTWTKKANLPTGGRAGGIAFAIDSLIYITAGQDGSNNLKDLWAYNPSTNTWTQKANFPGTGRIHPTWFVINGKAIVGGGYVWGVGTGLSDYYEYDPANNQWTSISGFAGGVRGVTASFTINNEGYTCLGRGSSGSVTLDDFWKYSDCPTSYYSINMYTCDSIVSPSGKYVWKLSGNNMDTVLSSGGCDSILNISLSIGPIDSTLTVGSGIISSNEFQATAYQWILCDSNSILPGETSRSITNVQQGKSYAVIITKGNCIDTSKCVNGLTSIVEHLSKNILIYPNPVRDILNIDLNTDEAFEVVLFNLTGNVVIKKSNTRSLNLSTLSPGIYILNVATNRELYSVKLSKK